MLAHSSSASSSSGATVTAPVVATFKPMGGYVDSCTYVKQKDVRNEYGCYFFRSCQSCLETEGCMVNDLGICVSQTQGMKILATGGFQYSTSYYGEMNYLKATGKNLVLPKAATTNKAALANEQNWHFRAGEATYCKADDAVCKECKVTNFWRDANDLSALPDSRFCVGQNGCVCIQTCEVPVFKALGCQWKLSLPSSSSPNNGGGGIVQYPNTTNENTRAHVAFWEWLLVLLVIVVVHFFFRWFHARAGKGHVCRMCRECRP